MEQHHCSKGLQVVNRIRGPVVACELGELEVCRDQLLHDHLRERRVSTDVFTISRRSMAELFDPPVNLLEPLIQEVLSTTSLEDLLAELW